MRLILANQCGIIINRTWSCITAYNCTAELPDVSTLGFRPGQTVANQVTVPLDDGDLCVFALVDTDLIIDINGYYRETGSGSGFVPVKPSRLLDTRNAGVASLRAGVEVPLEVAGASGAAPENANGVALNITVIDPTDYGYLQVYPCGAGTTADFSNINYEPHDVRPNAVVVPVDNRGRICMRSLRNTDVTVDFTGYFSPDAGFDLLALDPIRMFDSRSPFANLNEATSGNRVGGGQVLRLQIAGERGIPEGAKAVSVNLTATDAMKSTYLTAFPCGTRPNTSNVNLFALQPATANGAMVKLSADGALCVFTKNAVHIVVDINGVWQ
jgi:hypothetical protein